METLCNCCETVDRLMEMMTDQNILDSIKAQFPQYSARMLASAVLISKWPEEIAISSGHPVSLKARELVHDVNDTTYHAFHGEFIRWRNVDIDTMQSELQSAERVVDETLSATPPDKDWFGEWERGSELQKNMLHIAQNFLQRCKDNPPLL